MRRRATKRPKKKKPPAELVTACDECGKSLNRTCVRTDGSGVCAGGCGIFAVQPNSKMDTRRTDKWMFFCSQICADGIT